MKARELWLWIALVSFGSMAHGAALNFKDSPGDLTLRISVNDFEGGFSVNGTQIQIGLGNPGSIDVPEAPEGGTVVAFNGVWVDLNQSTTGSRTIYFVDPKDPTRVLDILVVNITTGGIIDGAWISGGLGDLGSVPGGTLARDIQVADGSNIGISAPFLGGVASAVPDAPQVDLVATYVGTTLTLTYSITSVVATDLNLWLVLGSNVFPVFVDSPIPALPPEGTTFSIPFPFPNLGTVGFMTTLDDGGFPGNVFSGDFSVVDTGP